MQCKMSTHKQHSNSPRQMDSHCEKEYHQKWLWSSNVNNVESYEGLWTFLVAQIVKNLPAMQETKFQSLGWEDPLEKEMATHSSILALEVPWTEEPEELQSIGSQRDRT